MLLRDLRRAREAPENVDEASAFRIARGVLETCTEFVPTQSFRDPRGEWDPGLPELRCAVEASDAGRVQQIVGWCMMYAAEVSGKRLESDAAAIEETLSILEQRDVREFQFAILKSPWAMKIVAKQDRYLTVDKISPEKPGRLYFHRVFRDVVRFLQFCDRNLSTTAVVWRDAPVDFYDDAYETPLDFFLAQRKEHPISKLVTVRSADGWRPFHFEVAEELVALPPKSEAGLVFRSVLKACIRVAKLKQGSCADEIGEAIQFGCLLGESTQLDQKALELLQKVPHYQASLGRAVIQKPNSSDSSAIVALFLPIPLFPTS